MIGWMLMAAAAFPAAEPSLAWRQTEHSLALVRGERVVWQSNYNPAEGKPYFHPLAVGDGPALTDLRPADHRWHRALWFSWLKYRILLQAGPIDRQAVERAWQQFAESDGQ
jgi:hypothetical protein